MTQYTKRVKFEGILKDFEYAKGKPTRAFLKDVVSECGKIKKSFYWLEQYPANSRSGDKVSFEIKYNMTVGGEQK